MDNPSFKRDEGNNEHDTMKKHERFSDDSGDHGNYSNGVCVSPFFGDVTISDSTKATKRSSRNGLLVLSASDLLNKEETKQECETLIDSPKANGQPKVLVERSMFSQKELDDIFEPGTRPSLSPRDYLKKTISKCRCSAPCFKSFIYTMFPFINILKNYNLRTDLSGDVVSGLTVGIMHIPQGMAYGMLTTLPPVYGLYMSFFPVLVYFWFGSSKHISIGTFAVACLMVGSTVTKGYNSVVEAMPVNGNVSAGNQSNNTGVKEEDTSGMSAEEIDIRLQFAMSVTFLVGIVQLLMGFCRLGFITVYLSDPLISGFTTGAACHVFTSQIKHVFGIKTQRYSGAFKLINTYRDFFSNIPQTNAITLIISVLCMAILYCVGRFINRNPKLKPKMFMPVPIELIVVVLGTLISYLINLEEHYNVIVVDDIPTGLPVPSTHAFSRTKDVISDAIALAIVIFAISISMAKILAKKHDYEVNANQELIAFGIATVVSSFFSSCAPSASLSRSLVQEGVGGKTQIAGLLSCVLLLVVLLAIGPYFRTLPNCILAATIVVALRGLFVQVFELPKLWKVNKIDFCVLAAIIIVALRGMFLQIFDLKKLWNVSKIDFAVWIVAFLATVVLDVDIGLGVAVIFAILTVVCRSQRPYACLLGQIPGTDLYTDIGVYQEAKEIDGLKIFRFEQSLFFVNTEHFRMCLYKKTVNPRELKLKQLKRESKLQKQQKKMLAAISEYKLDSIKRLSASIASWDEEIQAGADLPDVSVPDDFAEMELDVKSNDDVKITVVGGNLLTGPQDINFHTIIIDCSSWSFVDSMAVKVLSAVIGEYKAVNVQVCLANCKSGVKEMFEKTKFYDTLDHSCIYVTIHDAIVHSQHRDLSQNNLHNISEDNDEALSTVASTATSYKDAEYKLKDMSFMSGEDAPGNGKLILENSNSQTRTSEM